MNTQPTPCADMEEALAAVAAGEADRRTQQRVAEHVAECEGCRRESAALRKMEAAVTSLRQRPVAEASRARSFEDLRTRLTDIRSRLVVYDVVASPIGPILIAQSEQGVVLVEYLGRGTEADALKVLRHRGLEPEPGGDVARLGTELTQYLAGRRDRLEWPLDLQLVKTPFSREVLQFTASIPRGAVVSYAGLATDIGRPRAVRAAAQALRWNPLPIVIPCHRVIGTSGVLTGYSGGSSAKKHKLLAVEGIHTVRTGGDFRIQRDSMYVLAPKDREYCLPSCPTVDFFPRGGFLFGSNAQAEKAGFAPCTTCRPDLHPLPGARV